MFKHCSNHMFLLLVIMLLPLLFSVLWIGFLLGCTLILKILSLTFKTCEAETFQLSLIYKVFTNLYACKLGFAKVYKM